STLAADEFQAWGLDHLAPCVWQPRSTIKLRSVLVRVLALVVCLGFVTALFAADGVVVSTEKGAVTVKVGDKEYKVTAKDAKILDDEGKELKGKATAQNLNN